MWYEGYRGEGHTERRPQQKSAYGKKALRHQRKSTQWDRGDNSSHGNKRQEVGVMQQHREPTEVSRGEPSDKSFK